MAKSKIKIEARVLRQGGESIKTIANKLDVSSSTVSLWCRDIKLSKEQIKRLENNSRDPFYGKRLIYLQKVKNERVEKERWIINKAKLEIGLLGSREKLLLGAALYWAEGFKKDKMVGFSNSDPKMLLFILSWLENEMGVNRDRIRLRVVINESHKYRINEIESYWRRELGFDDKYFYIPTFQKTIWKKSYEHPEEYFGVLRLRVLKSTDLLRRIKGMILGLTDF